MTTRRSAFSEAVTTGPFAAIYWATFILAVCAVVAGFFGTQAQRIITGAIVFVSLVALAVARYVVASRIEKRRADRLQK
jgi:hypothetical protein